MKNVKEINIQLDQIQADYLNQVCDNILSKRELKLSKRFNDGDIFKLSDNEGKIRIVTRIPEMEASELYYLSRRLSRAGWKHFKEIKRLPYLKVLNNYRVLKLTPALKLGRYQDIQFCVGLKCPNKGTLRYNPMNLLLSVVTKTGSVHQFKVTEISEEEYRKSVRSIQRKISFSKAKAI